MRLPIKLVPQGIIPRDPNLTFLIKRATPPAVAAAAPTEAAEEEVTIGAGADDFADATVIPYASFPFRDVLAAYTYNKSFTTEVGEPMPFLSGITPHQTAWWKLVIPPGAPRLYLRLDTLLTFQTGAFPFPDTVIQLYALDGDAANPADAIFANLISLYRNNDFPGSMLPLTGNSMIVDAELDGDFYGTNGNGTAHYVQVSARNSTTPSMCYVLRVSGTTVKPGEVPPDGHDPDV